MLSLKNTHVYKKIKLTETNRTVCGPDFAIYSKQSIDKIVIKARLSTDKSQTIGSVHKSGN